MFREVSDPNILIRKRQFMNTLQLQLRATGLGTAPDWVADVQSVIRITMVSALLLLTTVSMLWTVTLSSDRLWLPMCKLKIANSGEYIFLHTIFQFLLYFCSLAMQKLIKLLTR